MAYKTRVQKDFELTMKLHAARIETAKQKLITVLDGPDAMQYVAVRASTYEPVGVSASGALSICGYNQTYAVIKTCNSLEEAQRLCVRAHQFDKSSIFIALRYSHALNHHVKWLERRKQSSIDLHVAMTTAPGEKKETRGRKPWWNKV